MTKIDIIAARLNALPKLAKSKEVIYLNDIRKEFRSDLQQFIMGETLTMQNGKVVIGKNLYNRWLKKIAEKGFDYEISF